MNYAKWCRMNSGFTDRGVIKIVSYLGSRYCCKQGKHVRGRRKGDQWSCLQGQLTNNISTRSRLGFPRKQDELILLFCNPNPNWRTNVPSFKNNAIELTIGIFMPTASVLKNLTSKHFNSNEWVNNFWKQFKRRLNFHLYYCLIELESINIHNVTV